MFGEQTTDAMKPLAITTLAGLTDDDINMDFFDERIEKLPDTIETDVIAMTVETFTAKRAYMDLGSLFGHFSDNKDRKAIINGYQSVLNCEINPWYIEPYFALQVILFIACQYERANEWEWFQGAMQRWCKDIFEPLHNKIAFLYI